VGQEVKAGERFGLIRFGSRLDIYIPGMCVIKVNLKQQVFAGETVIGEFNEEK
jgi:phosphatidylserine decarboxylase